MIGGDRPRASWGLPKPAPGTRGPQWRLSSSEFDSAVTAMGLTILKTPSRVSQANAFRERLVGTVRREVLDFLIRLNEKHLRNSQALAGSL